MSFENRRHHIGYGYCVHNGGSKFERQAQRCPICFLTWKRHGLIMSLKIWETILTGRLNSELHFFYRASLYRRVPAFIFPTFYQLYYYSDQSSILTIRIISASLIFSTNNLLKFLFAPRFKLLSFSRFLLGSSVLSFSLIRLVSLPLFSHPQFLYHYVLFCIFLNRSPVNLQPPTQVITNSKFIILYFGCLCLLPRTGL